MDNVDNILKKILLNMRYDSNKTLKENKSLLEEDKQYVLASDGRTLELPLNAVINSTHSHSMFNSKSIIDLESEFPLWSKSCKTHKPKEYGKCLNDYKRKWINSVKDGSVRAFKIDGKQYYQCYSLTVSNVLGTPDDLKIRGYSDNCEGRQLWTAYSKTPPKNIGVKVVNQACKTKHQTELPKAVSFWKNWLNNPTTRKKVEQNWSYKSNFLPKYFNTFSIDSSDAWNKYFDILDNLKLIFYDETMPNEKLDDYNEFAYVVPWESLYDIHVNCSRPHKEVLGIMIHEIQHLLYHVKPLNPAKKISDVFVDKNTKIEPMDKIFDISKLLVPINTNTLDVSKKIKDVSTKLNISHNHLEYWKELSIEYQKKEDPGYVCRETEKMSNIMSIRNLFGISAGFFVGIIASSGITLDMLMPYIQRKKHNSDVSWVLICWAQRNFPEINEMLDEINDLAIKQGDEQPRIGDLPKTNFS